MKTVCGIDLGTQSCKVVLYDYEAKKITTNSQTVIDLIAENDGKREQKAEWYQGALKSCFAALPEEAKKSIAAIGVSGQQHGFVPLDEKGKSLYNVKLWCDTSTAAECEEITGAAGGEDKIIAQAGLPMRSGYTAPIILSPPPAATGIPSGMPYSAAADALTLPAHSSPLISFGRQLITVLSMRSAITADHSRLRTSKRAVPDASPYSAVYSPVRR